MRVQRNLRQGCFEPLVLLQPPVLARVSVHSCQMSHFLSIGSDNQIGLVPHLCVRPARLRPSKAYQIIVDNP